MNTQWLTTIARLSPFKVTHFNVHASLRIVYYMHNNCHATLHRLSKRVITRLPFKSCCVCVCAYHCRKLKHTKTNKQTRMKGIPPFCTHLPCHIRHVNSHEENKTKMLNTQLKSASMRRVQCVFIAHSFAFVNFKDKQKLKFCFSSFRMDTLFYSECL